MTNEVFFGSDAAQKMKEGIDIGAKAVAVTLGGSGRTVFIYKKSGGNYLEATKDGVTVITSIRLQDQVQDAGLKLIQETSAKTANQTGDGTTSVCILMQAMIELGLKLKQAGVNPTEIKKGMDKACKVIVEIILSLKKDVGNNRKVLKQIATTSANNDTEIGDLIGGIYEKLGKNASVLVESSNTSETIVELVNGFQFPSGFLSDHFINVKGKNLVHLENPYILIIDGKIEAMGHIKPILEKVAAERRSILIIADEF